MSEEHSKNEAWISDLVSSKALGSVQRQGENRIFPSTSSWETFDRDCCMLLENCFFAQGEGIAFDNDALKILLAAQPETSGIDAYAVYGRTKNGEVIGLRGTFLEITGALAESFVDWLRDRSVKKHGASHQDGIAKAHCD